MRTCCDISSWTCSVCSQPQLGGSDLLGEISGLCLWSTVSIARLMHTHTHNIALCLTSDDVLLAQLTLTGPLTCGSLCPRFLWISLCVVRECDSGVHKRSGAQQSLVLCFCIVKLRNSVMSSLYQFKMNSNSTKIQWYCCGYSYKLKEQVNENSFLGGQCEAKSGSPQNIYGASHQNNIAALLNNQRIKIRIPLFIPQTGKCMCHSSQRTVILQ